MLPEVMRLSHPSRTGWYEAEDQMENTGEGIDLLGMPKRHSGDGLPV